MRGPERGAGARRASEEEMFWSGALLGVEVGGVRNATWRNRDPGSRSRGDGAVAGSAASCLGSVAQTWHVRFCSVNPLSWFFGSLTITVGHIHFPELLCRFLCEDLWDCSELGARTLNVLLMKIGTTLQHSVHAEVFPACHPYRRTHMVL